MAFRKRSETCIVAGLMLASLAGPADAAQLSRESATAKAVAILKGNPYGKTSAEVRRNIVGISLVETGKSACGAAERPQWSFHVSVSKPKETDPPNPIDGHLVLDAATGKIVCSQGLPFLD